MPIDSFARSVVYLFNKKSVLLLNSVNFRQIVKLEIVKYNMVYGDPVKKMHAVFESKSVPGTFCHYNKLCTSTFVRHKFAKCHLCLCVIVSLGLCNRKNDSPTDNLGTRNGGIAQK